MSDDPRLLALHGRDARQTGGLNGNESPRLSLREAGTAAHVAAGG